MQIWYQAQHNQGFPQLADDNGERAPSTRCREVMVSGLIPVPRSCFKLGLVLNLHPNCSLALLIWTWISNTQQASRFCLGLLPWRCPMLQAGYVPSPTLVCSAPLPGALQGFLSCQLPLEKFYVLCNSSTGTLDSA